MANGRQPLPPERWMEEEAYLEGIKLFNTRQFWESHEAWEEIWLCAEDVQAEFLQGLIQSAAALLKYQRGEPAPAKRLYETSMRRLSLCPDSYMGLNVRGFQSLMAACFHPINEGPYQPVDPANIPSIEV